MHYSKLTTIFSALLLLSIRAFTQQPVNLHYTLSLEDPASQKMHVVFRCTGLNGPVLDFKMPVWMPGYYQILDYAKKVDNFHAIDGAGKDLGWEKTTPNTWRVENPAGKVVTISYDVKATTPFVAQPWLDSTRGYVSPAGVFMYPNGYLRQPVTLEVKSWSGWNKIATGLEKVAGKVNWYKAPDFDILYDCPILAANLEEVPSFKVRNIPHYFYGYKIGEFDKAAFSSDLQKIVEQGVNLIGDIPYAHYTFLATGSGRGGIEHLNSTTIGFSGDQLKTHDAKQRVYCFIAHEYFHHYNVKRIRPIALGPFDYERENRTNGLWVSEGLNVYYEYMLVRRAGLMTGDDLLHHFQTDINAYESKPGHLYQSLAQSSYETWSDGPFGRTGDSINKTISYYQKGPAVGLLLDMAIRHSTKNKKSLDDVMRTVYRVYYQEKKRGFTDAEFRKACEDAAGVALPEIFDYVYTVKEPDYAKYLAYGGLGIDTTQGFKLYPLKEVDELQAMIRKDWLKE
ncbi:MAG: M61 family metallopeptidase [Bacteroidetes bacterium]|nr:M61 family metallopeptidase [Bacteroidota bacterium]